MQELFLLAIATVKNGEKCKKSYLGVGVCLSVSKSAKFARLALAFLSKEVDWTFFCRMASLPVFATPPEADDSLDTEKDARKLHIRRSMHFKIDYVFTASEFLLIHRLYQAKDFSS